MGLEKWITGANTPGAAIWELKANANVAPWLGALVEDWVPLGGS